MKRIAIQISPVAKSAYFGDYLKVVQQEWAQVFGDIPISYFSFGPLEYLEVKDNDLNLHKVMRLSFAQGVYALENDLMRPLDLSADFKLHEDFVFGSKFKGKTNERLTQMLINVGLAEIQSKPGQVVKLLDPMCGRATTLLWAMRYGINARGIEQDPKSIMDVHRILKKWTKLHRQKHKLLEGFIGPSNKKGLGKFLDFSAEENNMRMVIGDACDSNQIFKKEKFDLIVCDLPYGVQHFTTDNTRNPLSVITQCVDAWKKSLKKRSAIVLAFNSNNPKRDVLIEAFEKDGFESRSFSASHRMSESIVRDVVIFRLKQ